MKDLYVRDIVKICDGKLICGNLDQVLGDFSNDTRKLKKGNVYVGIKGKSYDGNIFYDDAIEKGANVCILEYIDSDVCYDNVSIVIVDDSIKAIQKLAKYKRSLYDIPVIAVTGSVGKTSTKDMIYSVVCKKYKTHKTLGNLNNHIGVPLTILSLHDHEALVIELGMNHAGELSLLTDIVKPTIAVITNVGTAHIENFGSRDNILKAKLEILEGLITKDVIINNDNDMLHKELEKLEDTYNIKTIGIDNDSNYIAFNIRDNVFSSVFDIKDVDKDIEVPVGGKVFIYNALVSYAIGDLLEIDKLLIKQGIKNFKLSSHRLEMIVNSRGITIIDDTYNASYDSMKSSLELLGKIKNKRKIAILGDMLELGDYSDSIHSSIGDIVVSNNIDILITIGNYSKNISKRVLELGMDSSDIYSYDNEKECYKILDSILSDNDIVLIKGSHGMNLINIVDYLKKK